MKDIFTLAIWLKYKAGHETIALSMDPIEGDLKTGAQFFSKNALNAMVQKQKVLLHLLWQIRPFWPLQLMPISNMPLKTAGKKLK